MNTKYREVIASVMLLVWSTLAVAELAPDAPINCKDCDKWNQPQAGFQIFGNTYYVGTTELSAILISTSDGLILIDAALPQSAPLIDANIQALGFATRNIRLILNSHAHYDHAGGIAVIQRASGATVAAGPGSARALGMGKPLPDDPQSTSFEFPPVAAVRVIEDEEILTVGDVRITAHFTPGHTPGGTTWAWRSCEASRCLNVVYADSLNAVSDEGYRFTGNGTYPSIVASFKHSIRIVGELPCDILLSPHAGFFGMESKLRRRQGGEADAFIDPMACRGYASRAADRLEQRISAETQP